LSLFGWDERCVIKWLARRDDRLCLGSGLPCKRRKLHKVSSWSSSLSDKWWLVRVKRGSKHWLVQILNALDLILSTRLSIRILQVAMLVPTNVHARLELGVLLDAQWGWDECLPTGTRHKGSCEIGDLRASASISRSWLLRLKANYVIHVEVGWSERYRVNPWPEATPTLLVNLRGERACRWTLLLLLLLLELLFLLRIVLWLKFHILLAKNVLFNYNRFHYLLIL
jgi:hypothetical protein